MRSVARDKRGQWAMRNSSKRKRSDSLMPRSDPSSVSMCDSSRVSLECDVPTAARSADQASQSSHAKSALAAKQSQSSLCVEWRDVANREGKYKIIPLPSNLMHAFEANLSS